jgi:hypothetical protein
VIDDSCDPVLVDSCGWAAFEENVIDDSCDLVLVDSCGLVLRKM